MTLEERIEAAARAFAARNFAPRWDELEAAQREISRHTARLMLRAAYPEFSADPPRADRSMGPAVSLEASPELVATLDRQRKGTAA